ncbi:MAG: DUF424 family protein [Nanoarchaeota archaeon]
MLVKIHKAYRDVIAICDSELLGKKFEEEKLQIDVKESFFNGKEADEEEIGSIMEEGKSADATFNIVGGKSVELALKNNLITKENIIKIQGIPVALVLI